MANRDGAFGLRLFREGVKDLGTEVCFVPATDETALFVGDAVKTAGSAGQISGFPYKKTVAQVAATNPIYGIVVGFRQIDVASGMDLSIRHRPADTAMYVLVRPANHLDEYVIQADDDSATIAAVDIGLNADIVVGSGNATTGVSGMELDSSTKNTTATLQLKIVGVLDSPDNTLGVANQDLIVRLNNIENSGGTGTVGL